MNQHKKIGLLGLGARSTSYYLDRLNTLYHQRHGGFSTCPLTLINSDFDEFNPFLPDEFAKLEPALLKHLELLRECDWVLIPNISLHETFDRLSLDSPSGDKILHPVILTAARLKQSGVQTATIVGSSHSMSSGYLPDFFSRYGVRLDSPEISMQKKLDQLRQAVYWRKETPEQIAEYHDALQSLGANKAVIVACTELSIVADHAPPNVFDMVEQHTQSCIEYAFG